MGCREITRGAPSEGRGLISRRPAPLDGSWPRSKAKSRSKAKIQVKVKGQVKVRGQVKIQVKGQVKVKGLVEVKGSGAPNGRWLPFDASLLLWTGGGAGLGYIEAGSAAASAWSGRRAGQVSR